MDTIEERMLDVARRLERLTGIGYRDLLDYALLMVVTGYPVDLAVGQLKLGSVKTAGARLLIWAADEMFRVEGDVPEGRY